MIKFIKPLAIVLVLVLGCATFVYIQYRQIDSLRQQIVKSESDRQALHNQLLVSQATLKQVNAVQQTQLERMQAVQRQLDTAQRANRTSDIEAQIHANIINQDWGSTLIPADIARMLQYDSTDHIANATSLSTTDHLLPATHSTDNQQGVSTSID